MELNIAKKDGSLPQKLSMDRVWITVDGRAKLLDFPAPDIDRKAATAAASPAVQASAAPGTDPSLEFLKQLARESLAGTRYKSASTGPIQTPLPIHVRELLKSFYGGGSLDEFQSALDSAADKPAQISRYRRLSDIAVCVLMPFMIVAIMNILSLVNRVWMNKNPNAFSMRECLAEMKSLERSHPRSGSSRTKRLKALPVYIAGNYRELIEDSELWESSSKRFYFTRYRELANRIIKDTPQPTEQELTQAETQLHDFLKRIDTRVRRRAALVPLNTSMSTFVLFLFMMVCLPSLGAALFFPGGWMMRTLGITVVRIRAIRPPGGADSGAP